MSQTDTDRSPVPPFRQAALWLLVGAAWVGRVAAEPPALGPYVPPESVAAAGPSPTLMLVRTLASLALVLGLVVGVAWLLRVKGNLASPGLTSRLRVLESASLGPSRSLHLVVVGKQVLLLGGGSQVTCLATYDADELGIDPDAPHPAFDTFLAKLQWPARERTSPAEED